LPSVAAGGSISSSGPLAQHCSNAAAKKHKVKAEITIRMFLEQYKLESNPFAPKLVRPRFQSVAGQAALRQVERILDQSLHCLFLSGRGGIGKSSLIERRLKELDDSTVSLIGAVIQTTELFLHKVLRDLGMPTIDATATELRNILEVYLRHQAAKNAKMLLVADPLERLSEAALAELEWLIGLRYKNRPLIRLVLISRSEDLVSQIMPEFSGGPHAPCMHHRLGSFSLNEVADYIRAVLHGVGGEEDRTLFSDEAVRTIYAYTHGVIGDVNSLCFEALNILATGPEAKGKTALDTELVSLAAERLNLRYDPASWRDLEEALSADSVQQSDPGELKLETARLLVTSRGDVIAEVTLNRPRMVLGRDHNCDISLDSSYVSRYQNLFMETPGGWMLIDLNSTNGCFVNGRRVSQHELHDGDIIAVGHHQINFVGPHGRRPAARTDISKRPAGASTADTIVSPKPLGKADSA